MMEIKKSGRYYYKIINNKMKRISKKEYDENIKKKADIVIQQGILSYIQQQKLQSKKKQKTLESNIDKFDKKEIDTFTYDNIDNNTLTKLLYQFTKFDDNIVMNVGNTHYTLNEENARRLLEKLEVDELFYEIEPELSSDGILIQNIIENDTITFYRPKPNKSKNLITGDFFKYYHKLPIDLDIFGLYDNVVKEEDLKSESCFIQSLLTSELIDNKTIKKIKLRHQTRNLPMREIKKIAEDFELYITIRRVEDKKNIKHYGNKNNKRIELGLIDQHYFYIKKVNITSYALKNFSNEFSKKERWNEYIKKSARDKNRFITSYDLIKILIEERKDLLIPKSLSNQIMKGSYYKKFDNILKEDLYYDANINTQENDFKNKSLEEKKISRTEFFGKYETIFFDYETYKKGNKRIHTPYLVWNITDKGTNEFIGRDCGKLLLDYICENYKDKNILMIAHNLKYDFAFMLEYLYNVNDIDKGTRLMYAYGEYYYKGNKKSFIFIDSYAMISKPLSSFSKMFGMEEHKEILPYDLYDYEDNVDKRYLPINEILPFLKIQFRQNNIGEDLDSKKMKLKYKVFKKQFLENIKKWDCELKTNDILKDTIKELNNFKNKVFKDKKNYKEKLELDYSEFIKDKTDEEIQKIKEGNIKKLKLNIETNNDKLKILEMRINYLQNINEDKIIDIIKYSSKYCELDCILLKKGYDTFNKWMKEITGLDIRNYISLPSLANDYLLKEGCYDETFSLSGVVRAFIQKCVVGGRCMTANNEKQYVDDRKIADYDAVGLYQSSMIRMKGFLKGIPKVISDEELNYDFLKKQSGFFVEIELLEINKSYKFPLISYINENGIRDFSNEIKYDKKGNKINIYVDKTLLQDLITFHKIKFKIIKGYYFNEGHNEKINEIMKFLYYKRVEMKKLKNPIQEIYKLLANSSYGRTLMKPVETDTNYIYKKDLDKYIIRNYKSINCINELCNDKYYKVKQYKSIDDHFNNIHIGVEILTMSKRIMNEVMCLADDLNINMYYTDTDSIHIDYDKVSLLEEKFKEKYNRELNGKLYGQFHIDFDLKDEDGNDCEDIHSIKLIALGKKSYVDILKGYSNNKEVYGLHIRMKGIPNKTILYEANRSKNNKSRDDTIVNIYDKLYNNGIYDFDLLCGGNACSFEFQKNMSIQSRDKFSRMICYDDDVRQEENKRRKQIKII